LDRHSFCSFFFSLIPEGELTYAVRVVLGITAWTVTWWVTEALPIPATSLLPIVLLPTLGGLSMEQASRSYGDPIVFMYMGGFMIAIAIEKWKLHRRMVLHILRVIGTRSDRIILGVMIATAFLSMWISNAATALMMLPVALAVMKEVKTNEILSGPSLDRFSKSILLSVAYSASIGGLATLVGSVPNAVFAAMSKKLLDREMMFFEWFLFGFPVAMFLLILLFLYLTRVQFKIEHKGERCFSHDKLFLFGGGLSLATGFAETNLTGWIGENLQHLNGLSYIMLLIILTGAILFTTEIMSNTAVAK